MKVSLNWVKEYTKLVLPPDDLRERVSVSLTEVESVEDFGDRYSNVVTASVKKVEPHPETDKLLVLDLDIGTRNMTVVVQRCPVQPGDKVPYLPPGSIVPGEIGGSGKKDKVSSVSVKEVMSEGIVPSGKELGLSHDHTTVYKLDNDAKVGTPFNQQLDLTDQIMEIKNKALTHRPDAFSVEGISREIAAIQETKYRPLNWLEDWTELIPKDVEDRRPVRIQNDAEALCKRYIAVVLDDVKIAPSPQWMQIRLAKMGIRPVNNVVDISNYLMIEVGQPSHAFDYDKVVKKDPNYDGTAVITVRMAKGGESITTLDGQLRELYDDTIIIADSENPVGIAGLMGGKDTEISDDTTRVIFQVENLDMYNVRKSSMKLGIFSDAVALFSRGLDPNRCEPVLYRGISMLEELAGAKIASQVVDNYRSPVKSRKLAISTDASRARIGADVPDSDIVAILGRLGMKTMQDTKNKTITIEIPTYRRDISIPQDVDEEIVRIFGYDKLTPTVPVRGVKPVPQNVSRTQRVRIKEILKSGGANEFYTYSFVGKDLYQAVGLNVSHAQKLKNPLSPELGYMRPLLLPSLLEKMPVNIGYRPEYAGYEVDIVNPVTSKDSQEEELPEEPWHAGLVHSKTFYHARLYLELLLNGLYVKAWDILPVGKVNSSRIPAWIQYAKQMYHPSRAGFIEVGEEVIGIIGQIRPQTSVYLDLPESIAGFELDCDSLGEYINVSPDYKDPSKYPPVVHDFCFSTEQSVPYSALEDSVREADEEGSVIHRMECVDIYVDPKRNGEKKTTIRVTMQSDEKTLEDSDIEGLRSRIVESVGKVVGGKLAE